MSSLSRRESFICITACASCWPFCVLYPVGPVVPRSINNRRANKSYCRGKLAAPCNAASWFPADPERPAPRRKRSNRRKPQRRKNRKKKKRRGKRQRLLPPQNSQSQRRKRRRRHPIDSGNGERPTSIGRVPHYSLFINHGKGQGAKVNVQR